MFISTWTQVWSFSQPHSIHHQNQIQKQFGLDLKLKRDCCVFFLHFLLLLLPYRLLFIIISITWVPLNSWNGTFCFSVNIGRSIVACITIIVIIRTIVLALLTIFVLPCHNNAKPHSLSAHLQQNFQNMLVCSST